MPYFEVIAMIAAAFFLPPILMFMLAPEWFLSAFTRLGKGEGCTSLAEYAAAQGLQFVLAYTWPLWLAGVAIARLVARRKSRA